MPGTAGRLLVSERLFQSEREGVGINSKKFYNMDTQKDQMI